MSPKPTSTIMSDADKTREQLLSELQELKAQVAFLKEMEAKSKGIAEALRESESRYRIVADNTYDWEFWLGPGGNFIYTSPSCDRITGYRPDEFNSDHGLLLNIVHPDDREAWGKHLAEEKKAGHGDLEFRVITKAGDVRWVHHVCQPVFDEHGHFLGTRGNNRDITDRKRAEEELVDAKRQTELYLDLMGHDLNNLNQIALGYLEMAIDMVKDDKARELIKKPVDTILNSSKLIKNVRKLQKAKSSELKVEAIGLDPLLLELKGQYLNVPGKEVAIDYTPGKGCYVMANVLLRDVFSNLIENAIKHSGPSKSVWIGLGLERAREGGRDYCRVVVEDDGPGIHDTLKEKVFWGFRKGNAKAGGKGLGLYLVKTLVESYGGRVCVEDRVPGDHTKGARFVVMLPAIGK
jgi:PAS domain S-box-containing protein